MNNLKKILIEGSDGSGKSTIARKIEDRLDGNSFFAHWTAPPKALPLEAKKTYMDNIHRIGLELATSLDNHIIYDRFHLSDIVYLPLYSGGLNEGSWMVDEVMADLGFKLVVTMAEPHTLKSRLEARGDWFIDVNDVGKIQASYIEALKKTKLNYFIYWTDMGDEYDAMIQDELLYGFLGI